MNRFDQILNRQNNLIVEQNESIDSLKLSSDEISLDEESFLLRAIDALEAAQHASDYLFGASDEMHHDDCDHEVGYASPVCVLSASVKSALRLLNIIETKKIERHRRNL
jgi:hypothetical protein